MVPLQAVGVASHFTIMVLEYVQSSRWQWKYKNKDMGNQLSRSHSLEEVKKNPHHPNRSEG